MAIATDALPNFKNMEEEIQMLNLQEEPKLGTTLHYQCRGNMCWTDIWVSGFGWVATVALCPMCGGTHFFQVSTGDAELDEAIAAWKIKL